MGKLSGIATWHRRVVMAASGASALLGLVVLVGWYTHSLALIQVLPSFVPMQYNTALGFLLCGIGLLSFTRGRARLAVVCGAAAGAVGMLTLVEYIFGLNLGIDQLLMEHYITLETSHPGRMAPNTALCFSLVSAALLVMGCSKQFKIRPQVLGILGSLVLILGVVPFIGYLSGASTAYGWGQLTRMAVHTAAGFIALGVGIVAQAWIEGMETKVEANDNSGRQRRKVFVLAVAIMSVVTLTVALNVIRELRHAAVEQRKTDLSTLTRNWAALIGAVARFDAIHSEQDHPEGAEAATLSQIAEAQEELSGVWKSGEFSLAKLDGGQIVYLLGDRLLAQSESSGTPFDSEINDPMLLALNGESGVLIVLGQGDGGSLAAHEPIGQYGWGLVARVDLAELRESYRWTAILAVGTALVVIVLGAFTLLITVDPTIRGMVKRTEELNKEVAERKRIQKELRQFEHIVSNSRDMMALLDKDYVYLAANDAYSMAFEKTRDQLVGHTVPEVFGQEFFDTTIRPNAESCMAGEVVHFQGCFEFPAHGGRLMDVVYSPFMGLDGEVNGFVVIGRDITEQKQAQEELRRLDQQLRTSVEQMPIAYIMWDREFRAVEWNEAAERVFGYSRSEMIGNYLFDYIVPEAARPAVREVLDKLLAGEKSNYSEPGNNIRKDGTVISCLWYNTPLRDESGNISGVLSMAMDITERKRAEDELQVSEERYRALFERSRDAVMTLAPPSWKFTSANQATVKMFGAKDEAHFTSLGPWEVSPKTQPGEHRSSEKGMEMIETAMREGSHFFEWTHKRVNGEEFPATVLLSRMEWSGKPMLQATVRDITHEAKLEEQLRQAQKMEAVGQLAGGVAHDFNNLLYVIQGYTEMAMKDLSADSPTHELLGEVMKASERAAMLVSQLLAFSRRQVLDMKNVDLNGLVADLMKMTRRVIGEHITLDVLAGHDLGIVSADPGQLQQILMNLCVNARDAMPTGGTITIETENVRIDEEYCVSHTWAKPGRYALLSVTDTGCGMDDETLGQIFEPFFTTKDVGEGTGLGLATVYGLVKQHKGMVHVYSEVGKGTTFKIYLPLVERSAAVVGDKIEGPLPGGTETILMAEDDEMVRKLTKAVLKDAGYTVLSAGDGEEALRVFDEHADKIALALLDVMMPKLGGRAVLERIRKVRPGFRVLFSSGYSMNAIHTSFVLDEGLALIQKPFQRGDLLRRVREVLDSSEDQSE